MNVKLLFFPAIGILIMLGMFLSDDARTLHIEQSDLPVNRTLAVDISKRYLAGWWRTEEKLDSAPFEMRDVHEMSEEIVVELSDERDPSSCKGFEVVINKSNGTVKNKKEILSCR
ncbi:hypothetical protein V6B33_10370 [Mangrovibacillus sp. Mu-81]|jgi:hypothetical protein|uniref:hypothetical protein n=1 Tax=Mangrovibacillus sp. Mu-81 TaxID=3121478 RepID=UPI002FE4EEBD